MRPETFARWVFRLAGLYGLAVITPLFALEGRLGQDYPPPINHPENFYGFASVGVAWQILFLLLATDPVRYRLMMLPSFLEKAIYAIAMFILFVQQRVPGLVAGFAVVDLALGVLFLAAYWMTRATAMINRAPAAAGNK